MFVWYLSVSNPSFHRTLDAGIKYLYMACQAVSHYKVYRKAMISPNCSGVINREKKMV